MTRPMPKAQRAALVAQERGRRKVLAQAVHTYITEYEAHPGYDIDYSQWTEDDARLIVQSPYDIEPGMTPHCLCEEVVLTQFLWQMVRNEPQ